MESISSLESAILRHLLVGDAKDTEGEGLGQLFSKTQREVIHELEVCEDESAGHRADPTYRALPCRRSTLSPASTGRQAAARTEESPSAPRARGSRCSSWRRSVGRAVSRGRGPSERAVSARSPSREQRSRSSTERGSASPSYRLMPPDRSGRRASLQLVSSQLNSSGFSGGEWRGGWGVGAR